MVRMAGLAEIIDENKRLREQLKRAESQRIDAETQRDQFASQNQVLEAKVSVLLERAHELEELLAEIERKKTAPKNERFVDSPQELLPFEGPTEPPPRSLVRLEDEDCDTGEPAETLDDRNRSRKGRRGKPKRRRLQDLDLPKKRVLCPVGSDVQCQNCGKPLSVFGTVSSYRVEWVRGHFIVEAVVREKASCPDCPSEGVFAAPIPHALPRAACGNGLLTRVLIDKFEDRKSVV